METGQTITMPTENTSAAPTITDSLTVGTLMRYLIGGRRAILQVAGNRDALWLGLAMVLSVGFAREYDGADLWHEPWHLVLPLAASLVTSLVLYTLVFIAASERGVRELSFAAGYCTLLTFYWWTAPLAWLYAVPVERFLSPGDATAANLWFLAVVSLWRVLLITRALSVWLGASFLAMFFLVMLFADSVALLLAFASPKPIFNVMGGIRLSQPDAVLLDAAMLVIFFGGLTWLVWLIGACVVIANRKSAWSLVTASSSPIGRVSISLWGFAILLITIGIALLPIGQPQQRHSWQAERLLKSGEIDTAIQYMAQYSRADFPPIWDLPPRMGYGETTPSAVEMVAAIAKCDGPEWLRTLYISKLTHDPYHTLWDAAFVGGDVDPTEFEYVLGVFEKNVPADSFDRAQMRGLRSISDDQRIPVSLRCRLKAYLNSAKNSPE